MEREVLAARCEVLGPRHPDTLTTGNLAARLYEQGKHVEAVAMQREVLAARGEVLGPRHSHTLTAMGSLANTLWAQGKHAEAEAMQREVLAAQREVLGPRHPDTLTAMGNLRLRCISRASTRRRRRCGGRGWRQRSRGRIRQSAELHAVLPWDIGLVVTSQVVWSWVLFG